MKESVTLKKILDLLCNLELSGGASTLTDNKNGSFTHTSGNGTTTTISFPTTIPPQDTNGDDLGNHTATQNLNMGGFDIEGSGDIFPDTPGTHILGRRLGKPGLAWGNVTTGSIVVGGSPLGNSGWSITPVYANSSLRFFNIETGRDFIFDSDGTPLTGSSVANKKYVDDAISVSSINGTTQNASQVPFTPNGSISSTNVQDAIQEVRDEAATVNDLTTYALLSGAVFTGGVSADTFTGNGDDITVSDSANLFTGATLGEILVELYNRDNTGGVGITPQQLNRILNENKTIEVLLTVGRNITVEDIEITTGNNVGKKVFLTPDSAGTTIELILNDVGEVGDLINVSGNVLKTDATLQVIEGTADIVNLSGSFNSFTVTGNEIAVLRKIASNIYRIDGSYTEVNYNLPSANLYPETDVMLNGTSGAGQWTGTTTAIDPLTNLGNVLVHNANGTFQRTVNDIALTNGTSYTISLQVYIPNGEALTEMYLEDFGGSVNNVFTPYPSAFTTGWVTVTGTRTAANGGIRIRLHTTWGSSATRVGYYKNVVVTEN